MNRNRSDTRRRFGRLASACALIPLFELGCTVGPDYTPPEVHVGPNFSELSQTTSANPATQPSALNARAEPVVEWWSTFRDTELDSLVQRGVAENLDLQRATSRIRQARAELRIAGGQLYPQVNATGGYDVSRGSGNVQIPVGAFGGGGSSGSSGTGSSGTAASIRPRALSSASGGGSSGSSGSSSTSGGSSSGQSSGIRQQSGGPQSPLGDGGLPGVETELYQIGLDATWEIDIFGGVRRQVEAAADDLSASVEDRRDVLTSLVAEIARDYLQLRGLQQRIVIAKENLASQEDTLQLTQSRFKAGFATDLDVSREQTQVAETRATLPPLEAQARQMIHALSVLVAREPDTLTAELSTTLAIPAPPPDVPVGLPSDLLKRRPDIRRAERQIAAANARVGVATSDLFPKFSITGQLGLDSSHAQHLFDWDSRYFILSPGVSWNILDFGRTKANIESQTEQRQQLMLQYQGTVLQALKETEDALVNYATEQTRRVALDDAVKSARISVNVAKQQYQQGVVDFLTVLDTQRDLLSAEDSLVQSDQQISTNLVALYKALGGGWEVDAARQLVN